MLGCLRDIKVASINHWKGEQSQFGDWHLAVHHNDRRDTIAYHFFYSKEAAVRFAVNDGVRKEDVYVRNDNTLIRSDDVYFKCSRCGCKFNYGGGVLNHDYRKFPLCRECVEKILK